MTIQGSDIHNANAPAIGWYTVPDDVKNRSKKSMSNYIPVTCIHGTGQIAVAQPIVNKAIAHLPNGINNIQKTRLENIVKTPL